MANLLGGGGGYAAAAAPAVAGGFGGPAAGYQFGGALPFGGGGAIDFSGNPAALSAGYASAYNSALNFNQANYNQILGGYQNLIGNLIPAQQQVAQGYGDLKASVLGGIDQIGQDRTNQINSQFAAQTGNAAQTLIDRGLGNSTVQQSVNRGIESDRSRALVNLSDTLAQTRAGFESQLGQAQLQYQNQAAQQAAAAQQAQLNFMNSVMGQYPNAGIYGQLAQQFGQQRGLQDQMNQGMPQNGFYTPPGRSGYTPTSYGFGGTPGAFNTPGVPPPTGPTGYGYNAALTAYAPPDLNAWGQSYGGGYADPGLAWGGGGDWSGGDWSAGGGYGDALAAVTGYAPLQGGYDTGADYGLNYEDYAGYL